MKRNVSIHDITLTGITFTCIAIISNQEYVFSFFSFEARLIIREMAAPPSKFYSVSVVNSEV